MFYFDKISFLAYVVHKLFLSISKQQKLISIFALCSGNKRTKLNELKFDIKFCEIKAEDFQATFLILLA